MQQLRTFNLLQIFSIGIGTCVSLSLPASSAFATSSYLCPPNIGAAATSILETTCYAYYQTATPWLQAKASCVSHGGTLAVIKNSTIQDTVHGLQLDSAWVGAADNDANVVGSTEGNYFWIGDTEAFFLGGRFGTPVGYTNWDAGEPNNVGNENCMEIYGHGPWNDLRCSLSLPYICQFGVQMPPSSSSVEAESHGGGGGGLRPDVLKERQDQAAAKFSLLAHPVAPAVSSSSKSVALPSAKASVISSKTIAVSSSSKASVVSASSSSVPDASMIRIVATPTLNFRADARIDAGIKRVLKQGQTTRLLSIVDKDWAYILLPDGLQGYVWRKHLTK